MHSTLKEIATWIKTIELPAHQAEQPETERFYKDDTTEDSMSTCRTLRRYKGKEALKVYLTPLETLPLVAFLMQTVENKASKQQANNYSMLTIVL